MENSGGGQEMELLVTWRVPCTFLIYLDGLYMSYGLAATYPQMEDTPTSTVMTYPGRSPHPVLAG